ncbi:hypothetical protein LIA77_02137 [Sarocladium implicatum]|nr:hypothetical protein LIA77_02137 [Sarocladium implicatum]
MHFAKFSRNDCTTPPTAASFIGIRSSSQPFETVSSFTEEADRVPFTRASRHPTSRATPMGRITSYARGTRCFPTDGFPGSPPRRRSKLKAQRISDWESLLGSLLPPLSFPENGREVDNRVGKKLALSLRIDPHELNYPSPNFTRECHEAAKDALLALSNFWSWTLILSLIAQYERGSYPQSKSAGQVLESFMHHKCLRDL